MIFDWKEIIIVRKLLLLLPKRYPKNWCTDTGCELAECDVWMAVTESRQARKASWQQATLWNIMI